MSNNSKLQTPSSIARPSIPRPTSAMSSETPKRPGLQREASASKLPVYRRETSMPQIRRESSIPQIKREKSDMHSISRSRASVNKMAPPTSRGTKSVIATPSTPKTVEERKVSERNNPARGTRSGVSGISEKVMIGDNVMITSSQKKGIVLFVGETKFAKGTWIGVVLEDTTGKNDGSIGGVRYFTCPALRGVFVKEDKLEKTNKKPKSSAANTPSISRNDSAMSTDSGVGVEDGDLTIGDQVQISSVSGYRIGTLQFIGTTEFAKGTWCGIELNEASGKNDGAVAGTRYFQCQPKHGIFAQAGKVKKISGPLSNQSVPNIGGSEKILVSTDIQKIQKEADISLGEETVSPNITSFDLNDSNAIMSTPACQDNSITMQRQLSTEHQENTLRLMNEIKSLGSEKKELESKLNDSVQKVEDLQFQLEEQMMLCDDEKEKPDDGSSSEAIQNLKLKLEVKDREISELNLMISTLSISPSTDDTSSAELEKANNIIAQQSREIENLKEKHGTEESQKAKDDFANIQRLNDEINEKLVLREKELEKLQKDMQQLQEAKKSELVILESEFQLKSQDHEKQIAELNEKLKKSEESLEELKFSKDEMEADIGESQNIKGQLSQAQQLNTETNEKLVLCEKELEKLRKDIESLEETKKAELEFLESESQLKSQDYEKQFAELNNKLKKSVEQYEELKFKMDEMEAEASESQKTKSQAQQLNTETNEKLVLCEKELEKLHKDIESLEETKKSELEFLESESQLKSQDYEKQFAELNDKLKKSVDQYEELKFKMDEMEAEAGDAQKAQFEVVRLNELNSQNEQKVASYETELQKLQSDMEQLEQSKEKERQQLAKVELTLKDLSAVAADYEKLKSENNTLSATNKVIKQEMETLSNEIANLKTDKEFVVEESSILRQEKEDISKELETQANLAKENESKREELHRKNQELSEQIKLLETEKERLNGKCDQLTNEHLQKSSNEVTELYTKIKEVEDKLSASEREQITLKSEVALWKEKFTNEQELAVAGNQSLSEKSQEVDQLKSSIVDLKFNAQKVCDEKDDMAKKLQESSTNFDNQTKDLRAVKSEKELLVSEKEDLRKKHDDALSKIKTLELLDKETKSQINKMTELLEEQNQKNNEQLSNVADANKEKEGKIQQFEEQIKALSLKIEELNTLNKQQRDELDKSRSDVEAKEKEISSFGKEAREKDVNMETFQLNIEKLTTELTKTTTEKEEFNLAVGNLTKERDLLLSEKRLFGQKSAADLEKLTAELSQITTEKAELNLTVVTLTKERDSLLNEKGTLNQNLTDSEKITSELSKITTEKVELDQTLEILIKERDLLLNEKETLNKKLAETASSVTQRNSELDSMKDKMEQLITENNSLMEKCKISTEQCVEKENALINVNRESKQAIENEKNLKDSLAEKNTELSKKLETSEDIVVNQKTKIHELESKVTSIEESTNASQPIAADGDSVSSSQYNKLHDEMIQIKTLKDEKESEVNFLNSIIVDLQKKNKVQEDKIKILSFGDNLLDEAMNNTMSPPKPGLKMRSFCDICDVFDLHETEDCPLQSNEDDGGGSKNHGERGKDRPYCVSCEVFGHTANNCDDEEEINGDMKTLVPQNYLCYYIH